jgi:hypothetical protein
VPQFPDIQLWFGGCSLTWDKHTTISHDISSKVTTQSLASMQASCLRCFLHISTKDLSLCIKYSMCWKKAGEQEVLIRTSDYSKHLYMDVHAIHLGVEKELRPTIKVQAHFQAPVNPVPGRATGHLIPDHYLWTLNQITTSSTQLPNLESRLRSKPSAAKE